MSEHTPERPSQASALAGPELGDSGNAGTPGASRGPSRIASDLLGQSVGETGHRHDDGRFSTLVAPADADVSEAEATAIMLTNARRSERLVSFWFLLAAASVVGFIVDLWIGDSSKRYFNEVLGACMAGALGGIGVGAVLWAKRLMPHEEAVQDRETFHSTVEDAQAAASTFDAGVAATGLRQLPLLRRSFLVGTGSLGLLLIAPLRYLGARPKGELARTAWAKGVRMVTEEGTPVKIGDLNQGGVLTVFPEGHTGPEDATAATLLIHLEPGVNQPRPGRESFAYQDHVAYSKICTHAGCPVGLYEQQTHHLLCPCHQSQFDVVHGCKVIFGPASRSLPQLAITVDADGYFVAQAGYDQAPGPGYWERKP